MKKIYFRRGFALITVISPFIAYAQSFTDFKSFGEFILKILSGVISILFAAGALGLLYGVVLYFANSDNDAKREQIRPYLFWSVIGIAAMYTVYALVQLVFSSFFGGTAGIPFLGTPTP